MPFRKHAKGHFCFPSLKHMQAQVFGLVAGSASLFTNLFETVVLLIKFVPAIILSKLHNSTKPHIVQVVQVQCSKQWWLQK